ncbi:MAG: NAD(P)H-dependent oxidoreductase [Methylococcales bacterium]
MPKILAFSGSSRKGSFNTMLVSVAATAARDEGADVTIINLGDYPMPIYNADLEAEHGMPQHVLEFKQLLIDHQGLLIASPEYNSAFSPLLKNAIDWASRKQIQEEEPLVAFRGKYASIMSTSPGALGGIRGLVFLRMLLGNIGITVLPDQQAIPQAHQAFDQNGSLKNQQQHQAVSKLGIKLTQSLGTYME